MLSRICRVLGGRTTPLGCLWCTPRPMFSAGVTCRYVEGGLWFRWSRVRIPPPTPLKLNDLQISRNRHCQIDCRVKLFHALELRGLLVVVFRQFRSRRGEIRSGHDVVAPVDGLGAVPTDLHGDVARNAGALHGADRAPAEVEGGSRRRRGFQSRWIRRWGGRRCKLTTGTLNVQLPYIHILLDRKSVV